ncbi:hypothetical protein [Panacibacter microcysteis]|nr:hypothetical protein [Panacibacter microcysteis]
MNKFFHGIHAAHVQNITKIFTTPLVNAWLASVSAASPERDAVF